MTESNFEVVCNKRMPGCNKLAYILDLYLLTNLNWTFIHFLELYTVTA